MIKQLKNLRKSLIDQVIFTLMIDNNFFEVKTIFSSRNKFGWDFITHHLQSG